MADVHLLVVLHHIHEDVDMFMLDYYFIIHVTRQTLRHRRYVIRLGTIYTTVFLFDDSIKVDMFLFDN